jgi:hypothetical protein
MSPNTPGGADCQVVFVRAIPAAPGLRASSRHVYELARRLASAALGHDFDALVAEGARLTPDEAGRLHACGDRAGLRSTSNGVTEKASYASVPGIERTSAWRFGMARSRLRLYMAPKSRPRVLAPGPSVSTVQVSLV